MSGLVLVAYATRYGSTRDAAEKINSTLSELGFDVELKSFRQVDSVKGYRAVVMGAPIEIGRWHGDAHRFLSEFRQDLIKLPAAVFALGPLHRDEGEMNQAREQLDKNLEKYAWFKPVSTRMFVGRLDPTKLHFPASLFMKQIPASDEMDWKAIEEWAKELPALLGIRNVDTAPVTVVA